MEETTEQRILRLAIENQIKPLREEISALRNRINEVEIKMTRVNLTRPDPRHISPYNLNDTGDLMILIDFIDEETIFNIFIPTSIVL